MNPAGTAPSQRVKIQTLDAQGNPSGTPIAAHFNPTSLQYTITNTAAQGSSRQRQRAVDESTAKLTMDLVFDTTHSGEDVRKTTQTIAVLMKPGANRQTPIVQVTWGSVFKFTGALDQYRETLDFFSEDGVPLRASLSLGFTTVAQNNQTPPEVFTFAGPGDPDPGTVTQHEVPAGPPATIASALGNPIRAREIAAQNNVEDLRNGDDGGDFDDDSSGDFQGDDGPPDEDAADDDLLVVDSSPPLDPPIAFATGGAGVDAAAGAGFGIGAGASFNAGAGASFGASLGASAGAGFGASASIGFGASTSAGLGASAGMTAGVSGGFGASASAGFTAGASAGAVAGAGGVATVGAVAGAGLSASAGAGFTAGASASVSAGAAFSANASARAGGAASAGIAASAGAFARLRPPAPQARGSFDMSRVLQSAGSRQLTTDAPGAFGPGGVVVRTGSSSNDAEVGQSISLRQRIEFED